MSPEEVLAEFTDLEVVDGSAVLYVKEIHWRGPYTPVTTRTEVAHFTPSTEPAEIEKVRRALLKRVRYFGRCEICGEWMPRGWMHDPRMCQGCATEELGVVY